MLTILRFARGHFLFNEAPGADDSGAGGGGAAPPNGAPANGAPAGGKPDPKGGEVETISLPKAAFDERLAKAGEAAQRRFLKDLGFEKPDDVKEALKALKSLQDEKKSTQEKLEGRIKELEPKATRADVLAKRFESVVTAEFDKLPENIRTAIDKVADGDSEKRWEQIEVFRAAGVLGGQQQEPGKPPSAPKTSAPNGAPPPAKSGGLTKFDEWAQLREKNPVQASIFFRVNRAAIEASRPADQ